MVEAQEAKDAKEAVAVALQWLRGFVVVIAGIIICAFVALAVLVVWTLISIHTGQIHGAEHTKEILQTVTAHDKLLQNTLSNTCTLLKHNNIALPSWCLPKK